MSATKLDIISRYREHPGLIASLDDFDIAAAESIDTAVVLADPRYTLYSLDHANQRAIFSATPAEVDLSRRPFMYQAQFDRAERLVALPYSEFLQRAGDLAPPDEALIFLHNIGRCGSTALCRALNEIEGVMALSEPDSLAYFVSLRATPRAEQEALLRACVAWLCRPAVIGSRQRVLLKLRNQATSIMDLMLRALPQAAHLFMYRDAISWLASFHRLRAKRGDTPVRHTRAEVIAQQAAFFRCPPAQIEALAPPSIASYLGLEGRALAWLYMLERYRDLRDRGAAISALRYQDLQRDRDALLRLVLGRMSLPEADISAAQRVFDSDAQAGTRFARDDERGNQVALPEAMQATLRRVLAAQAVITRADYVLPGTLRINF